MSVKPEKTSVKIILPEGKIEIVPGGRTLLEINGDFRQLYPSPVVAALVNNKLQELSYVVPDGAQVEFLDLASKEGMRIYHRSLTFLLIHATYELFPQASVKVEHSLSKGLYCEINKDPGLTAEDVSRIEERMRKLVDSDLPLKKKRLPLTEVEEVFLRQEYDDKVVLLKYLAKDYLSLYSLDGLHDSLHGYHVPRTGILQVFALKYYMPGVVLRFPDEKDPSRLAPFVEQSKLFGIFREA